MALISFGEWLPDLPPTELQGATKCSNVTPDARSYRPFPSLVPFSTATGSRVRGGIFATDAAKNNYNYAGDASALYSLTGQSFNAATRLVGGGYSLAVGDYWEFANWNNLVIAVNGFTDNPQLLSLGGANFADLAVNVKARHIGVTRDFVILGNVSDSATNVYRVRWSAINNPLDFSASAATLSDFQDLPSEGGEVQKVLGGETTVVLQERAVWRMQFVGSPLIFQFDRVHAAIGALVPQAAIRYQNFVYFLAQDGFYSFDGVTLKPIGLGRVDKFFFDDLSTTDIARVHAAIDPPNKLVLWAYPSNDATGGNPDKLLAYSWAFNRWVLIEGLSLDYLMQATTTGLTLESLDNISGSLDALPASLDSIQWTGGQLILSAFNSAHKLGRFNGSAMAATVDTGEFQMFDGQLATVIEIWPHLDGTNASATVSILNRNRLTESVSVGASGLLPNTTGFCEPRLTARYLRIRLSTATGTDFTHLTGVDVIGTPAGKR